MEYKFKQLLFLLVVLSSSIMQTQAYAATYDQWQDSASLSVKAVVSPYTTVKLSTNEIAFEILGEPGEYVSKDIVEVTVGSNQSSWGVYVRASDLNHDNRSIASLPASRLAFSDGNVGFKSLENNVLLIKGVVAQVPKPIKLRFRLTTTWQDAPGVYRGKITFDFLNNP
ncbi:MAG TPA: hypothetical protein EYO74_06470 [Piscirickettsiaceae bacterium]|jgi:hypothetical protein|nr:hypothetical protein [Piscirickettsiaceae bacterium]